MVSVKMVRYLTLKSLPLKDLEWLHAFYLNIFCMQWSGLCVFRS